MSPEEGGEGPEDGDVDRPDPGGSWVVIGPSLVEGSEPEDVPWPVQPWILEAQSGELLPDGTEGFLHALRSDGERAAGEDSSPIPAGIDDEEIEVEGGRDVVEEGSVAQVGAESHPSREEIGSVGLCGRHDAMLGRF